MPKFSVDILVEGYEPITRPAVEGRDALDVLENLTIETDEGLVKLKTLKGKVIRCNIKEVEE